MSKALSTKEHTFVTAFLGRARGNATDAAKLAGYGKNRQTQATAGWKMLRKVEIQQAIVARSARTDARAILNADERDAMLSRIAKRTALLNPHEAISAIKELNKCTGRHSATIHHAGKVTMEQILAESWKETTTKD